ncbi:hypothetical protein PsalN5692_01534 [Piscirickettsia salmonis]|uniref:hypothetical protein n=1 Tax=Piscirickettsia salmonis TaxID=1238 RepID=UPI0012B6E164|nr:hypothetical protein [Piscirickettsia salmonis]QGP50074.1 hypothetical protein PsalN5692_01534 [Piscirickettsia salmonis]
MIITFNGTQIDVEKVLTFSVKENNLIIHTPHDQYITHVTQQELRKRRYLGRYFAHPMMQNRRAKRDDYKPSAVRVTQRCVP